MRLQTALWSAGLLASCCEAARASVYVSSPQASTHDPKTLSFEDARLYLAQRLGLSRFYQLDKASDAAIDIIGAASSEQMPLFGSSHGEEKGRRRTVMIVDGVDVSNDFFASRTPQFHIESEFEGGVITDMIQSFLSQDHEEKRHSKTTCADRSSVSDAEDAVSGGFSASDPLGLCEVSSQNGEWWQRLSLGQKLTALDAQSSEIISNFYSDAAPAWEADDMKGVFYVGSLQDIATKSGTSSSAYKKALKDASSAVDAMLSSTLSELTVVVLPFTKPSAAKKKRSAAPVSPLKRQESNVPSGAPRTTLPTCYFQQSACEDATASCSGHGRCVLRWTETDSDDEKGAECWGCACETSVLVQPDANGRNGRTISWGGPACQKKDVSVPFWLFASFGVMMATVLSYGLGMLYSVGQSELPSVLGAGVASVGSRSK